MAAVANPTPEALAEATAASPIPTREKREFRVRTEQVEKLIARLDSSGDAELRAIALELVQCVIEMHGAALDRLLGSVAAAPAGEAALDKAIADDLVSSVLLLHGLHPDPVERRVLRALDSVRPYLQTHKGDVEFVSLHDGVVHLRLLGSCGSCPSSSVTLKNAVEEALYGAAPEITQIVAEDRTEAASHPKLVVLK
jgi:Fe-S cluster biogenesis protein NfuA